MRPFMLGLLVGLVAAAALASCGGDSQGACASDSDCGRGRVCDPDLGCVPAESDGDADADTDADTDADSDADGDADTGDCAALLERCTSGDNTACEAYQRECEIVSSDCASLYELCRAGDEQMCVLARQQGCGLPEDCETLLVLCEMGDEDACAWVNADQCSTRGCLADGYCEPNCPGDPDCDPPPTCLETCGPLPATAGEACVWSCAQADDCVLETREPGIVENCFTVDGSPGRDEDCDGLVDCEDVDCLDSDACR